MNQGKYSPRLNAETMRLMSATHTAQRNSDHLFSNDVGSMFANRYQGSHIAFIGDDDPQGTDEPQGNDDPASNNPPPAGGVDVNSQAFKDAVAAAVAAQNEQRKKDEQTSLTEQRKREQEEKDKQERERQGIITSATEAAKFDNAFDGFISKNAHYFPKGIETVRKSVQGLNIEDPTNEASLLAATAAKEFFSLAENMAVLDSSDRAYVEKNITGKRFENEIDGLKAWGYVEKAMFGHGLRNKHTGNRNDGTQDRSTKTGYKDLDEYNAKFFPEHVKDLSDQY